MKILAIPIETAETVRHYSIINLESFERKALYLYINKCDKILSLFIHLFIH